jgi:ribosome biogenesis GTPase A
MTLQDKKRFDAFTEKLDHIAKEIAAGGHREEVRAIEKQKESFAETINDFCNKDRKLNIGIVGQAKAGKSSFLNTLLFDGEEVLPKEKKTSGFFQRMGGLKWTAMKKRKNCGKNSACSAR